MQRLEVSGAVRPLYGSLGVKGLRKMELRGNISTRLRQCTAYADDILMSARATQGMIDTFVKSKKMNL